MRDKYMFSDAQALGALTSTGVVSTNVLDMELDASGGNTILTNDQLVGTLNVQISANSGVSAGGVEGMDVYLRSCDNANMTSSPVELGRIFITQAELLAGVKKTIKVAVALTQCFVGLFFDPVSTTLDTGNTVDAWFSVEPDGTENDSIQKVPS